MGLSSSKERKISLLDLIEVYIRENALISAQEKELKSTFSLYKMSIIDEARENFERVITEYDCLFGKVKLDIDHVSEAILINAKSEFTDKYFIEDKYLLESVRNHAFGNVNVSYEIIDSYQKKFYRILYSYINFLLLKSNVYAQNGILKTQKYMRIKYEGHDFIQDNKVLKEATLDLKYANKLFKLLDNLLYFLFQECLIEVEGFIKIIELLRFNFECVKDRLNLNYSMIYFSELSRDKKIIYQRPLLNCPSQEIVLESKFKNGNEISESLNNQDNEQSLMIIQLFDENDTPKGNRKKKDPIISIDPDDIKGGIEQVTALLSFSTLVANYIKRIDNEKNKS